MSSCTVLGKVNLRSSAVDQFERSLWRKMRRRQTIIAANAQKCCASKGGKPKVCFVRSADIWGFSMVVSWANC